MNTSVEGVAAAMPPPPSVAFDAAPSPGPAALPAPEDVPVLDAFDLELSAQLHARWDYDIPQFAWDVFGVNLWGRQRDVCVAIARGVRDRNDPLSRWHRRTAVKSGQKTGKSILASVLALWWVVTRPRGRVVLTAPTGNQVRAVLWTEIQTLYAKAEERLEDIGGIGGHIHKVPDRGLQFLPGNEIIGRATDKAANMQGISGRDLLYIVDEASGVDQSIIEAIVGNTQGGGFIILFGNPNQTSGELFDAFHRKASLYNTFTISSEETPNVVTRRTVIEGLADYDSIEQNKIAWGPDYLNDPRYQVRVLGQFPTQSANSVITLGMVLACHKRWHRFACHLLGADPALADTPSRWHRIFRQEGDIELVRRRWESWLGTARGNDAPLILGIDPARFGQDATVIVPRRGRRVFRPVRHKNLDGRQIAEAVDEVIGALALPHEVVTVRIDAIGNGASAVDYLMERQRLRLVPVVSSERAFDDEEYFNLRAEMHFMAAAWMKGTPGPGGIYAGGGAFEPYADLDDELVVARFGFDPSGRLRVQEKDEIKRVLGRSPDHADGLHLAVYEQPEKRKITVFDTSKLHTLKTGLRFGDRRRRR